MTNTTTPDRPGDEVLAGLAEDTSRAARSRGFDDDRAFRAAAGAVLGAVGSDRPAPEAAERGKVASAMAAVGRLAGSADRWADFVVGVLNKSAS